MNRQPFSRNSNRRLMAFLFVTAVPMSTTMGQTPAGTQRLPGSTQRLPAGTQRLPVASLSPPSDSTPSSAGRSSGTPSTSVQQLFESFEPAGKPTQTQPVSLSNSSPARGIGGLTSGAAAQRWLRTSTSSASREVSRRLIEQASAEYAIGAWASAETSAWEGLRFAAEAVELASRENANSPADGPNAAALANLQIARTAIREARDFGGQYGAGDRDSIRRMAMSHQTAVLDYQPVDTLTAADAIDRYLDEARIRLSGIASQSVEAAQAMDLLAAIYLGRADVKTLPSSTALCLRRAALQGQPGNASLALRLGMHLADLGLYREARSGAGTLAESGTIAGGFGSPGLGPATFRPFRRGCSADRVHARRRPSRRSPVTTRAAGRDTLARRVRIDLQAGDEKFTARRRRHRHARQRQTQFRSRRPGSARRNRHRDGGSREYDRRNPTAFVDPTFLQFVHPCLVTRSYLAGRVACPLRHRK